MKISFLKYTLKILIAVLSVFSIEGLQSKPKAEPQSFEELMGKSLECWRYVVAPIDQSNLEFYKELFERESHKETAAAQPIPKTLHFIWLGPKEFPRESIQNVISWIEKHPSWKVKFWTDRKRNLPHEKMEECLVGEWTHKSLQECYYKTGNFAERADLLRYEILWKEGGLYVDHDVKCFRSFDQLNERYEMYCGLELPSDTPLSSSVHVTNNLIGIRPKHPVMENCINWIPIHWDQIETLYPGKEKEEVIRRIANRTFTAFADSVRQLAGVSTQDIVFPAYYFNASTDEDAIYARHLYMGTWFQGESVFEKMAKHRLMYLSKKVNKLLVFCALSALLNILGVALLFVYIRKKFSTRSS